MVLKEKISETGDSELSLTQSHGGHPLNIMKGMDKRTMFLKIFTFLKGYVENQN